MKTIIRLFCALAAAAPAGLALRAADPPAPRTTGKVLVLDNEHTLEGDVERVGEQYRVRRSIGETWLPAAKVLCLCDSREDAYAYLHAQANLRDADERLRLARWCHQNGLREQALAEVRAAVELRPNHPESRRLLSNLERSQAAPPAAAPAPPKPREEPEAVPPPPGVEVSAECVGLFSSKVQPILMNACSGCHATGRGGAFKLLRPFDVGSNSRRSVQQNLAAVLAQVNLEKPQMSPLLTKAVSQHGEMLQPPLKGRQTKAFQTLEDWVRVALANNPQLREAAAPAPAAPAVPVPAPPASEAKPGKAEPVSVDKPAARPEAPPAGPADPFDPVIFNRQMHPEKEVK
jgi:hypothetical protein